MNMKVMTGVVALAFCSVTAMAAPTAVVRSGERAVERSGERRAEETRTGKAGNETSLRSVGKGGEANLGAARTSSNKSFKDLQKALGNKGGSAIELKGSLTPANNNAAAPAKASVVDAQTLAEASKVSATVKNQVVEQATVLARRGDLTNAEVQEYSKNLIETAKVDGQPVVNASGSKCLATFGKEAVTNLVAVVTDVARSGSRDIQGQYKAATESLANHVNEGDIKKGEEGICTLSSDSCDRLVRFEQQCKTAGLLK